MPKLDQFPRFMLQVKSTRKFTVASKGISCITKPQTQSSCNRSTVKPRFTNASNREQFGLRTNFPNTTRLG